MNVAIIGAGISGLSCAIELRRNGITPTVFESKKYIGEGIDFGVCKLRLFNRYFENPMDYLNKYYNIHLNPLNPLDEITMVSQEKEIVIKGNLGYKFWRGENKCSIESQLINNIDFPINFNTPADINNLKTKYDYVLVATGDDIIAKNCGIFNQTFTSHVRIATTSGNYKPNSWKIWLNTDYAKNAYAYLAPKDFNKAGLVLIVNDIKKEELDYYWNKFIKQEKITDRIEKTIDVMHNLGYLSSNVVDNVLFSGIPGGCIDDCLGFGVVKAIESGVLAARSIIYKLDYNKLLIPIKKDVQKKHEFRKVLNTFNNKKFNMLVGFLGLPVIKQSVYNNPLSKITYCTFLAKAYNKFYYKNKS